MCIRDRYQPYVASSTTSGHWPARAITDANRCTSLTIRTVSSTSPASVVRTITVLRRCRSIPTNCFPAYASIRGLLALSHGTLTLPSIHAGRRRWEREEAPLLHHIRRLRTVLRRQSRRGDSNPQPPVYKTGALPVAPRRRSTVAEDSSAAAGRRNLTCPRGIPGAPS